MSIFFQGPKPVRNIGGAEAKLPSREQLTNLVKLENAARGLRHAMFDSNVLNEQAWVVLRHLFEAHLVGRQLRSKAVCQPEGLMAPTTVLRYLDHLEKFGLVVRTADPDDSRVKLVSLTESAIFWLEEYYGLLIERHGNCFKEIAEALGPGERKYGSPRVQCLGGLDDVRRSQKSAAFKEAAEKLARRGEESFEQAVDKKS